MPTHMIKVDTALGWLTCRVHGDGLPVVVCIHGFCQSSAFWESAIARWGAAGARALAVDLPGFGSAADAPGPYTMESYADHIAALLDALTLARATVVGGSMGGVVAQHFALRHPGRVERIVLVATGARTPDPAGALAKADRMAAAPLSDDDIAGMVDGFFFRPRPEPERRRYGEIVRAASRAAAVAAARSNARSDTLDRLPSITAPTLVVQGRHDRGRTPEHGELMCRLLPDARLTVLEHAGHTPQLEEPEAFHEAVAPFVFGTTTP
jgi:pimeloyl-ACP methyl ester carboxylesterase